LKNGAKQKLHLLLCELTDCAGSAMGPRSDAAGASHKDVASQKVIDGLFPYSASVETARAHSKDRREIPEKKRLTQRRKDAARLK
jgi:hypothetical protein